MKKTTLMAIAAMMSVAAQAQYSGDASNTPIINQHPASLDYILLSEGAINEFTAGGTKVTDLGPNDVDRHLWVWDNTFSAGDSSYPRVDMEEGGYVSLTVGTAGWSGAGFAIDDVAAADLSNFNEDTRFHLAYMTTTGNAPASIALILLDGTDWSPAKVALGSSFDDNGAIFPAIGPKANDEWQGVDISFADLKKLYPSFNYNPSVKFAGNIFAFLGGGVTGQSFSFDAVYFYNLKESGIEDLRNEAANMVITGKTINVAAGRGVELYNLGGQLVKKTNGCVLGLNGLQAGIYLAKSGREVRKVVVR